MNTSFLGIACAVATLASSAAYATTVTSTLNVDNAFTAYISTDDNVAGTEYSSGASWQTAITGTGTLIDVYKFQVTNSTFKHKVRR